jgi:hypothetical protein
MTVVFFNHPGGEHWGSQEGGLYLWNRKKHRRKYLVARGKLADRQRAAWRISDHDQRMLLWAEYEPDTISSRFPEDPSPGLPWAWHETVPMPIPPRSAANTEPWIFGRAFRYFLCRQSSLEYLRDLHSGDLLLFGSWMKQGHDGRKARRFNFFLDTVFVIDDSVVWPPRPDEPPIPDKLLDPSFVHGSFAQSTCRPRRRFYWGKMLGTKPTREPFCWSPCAPWVKGHLPPRERRPMIGDLFGEDAGNGQVFRKRLDLDPADAWRKVTERCVDTGYSLAVSLKSPKISDTAKSWLNGRRALGTIKSMSECGS